MISEQAGRALGNQIVVTAPQQTFSMWNASALSFGAQGLARPATSTDPAADNEIIVEGQKAPFDLLKCALGVGKGAAIGAIAPVGTVLNAGQQINAGIDRTRPEDARLLSNEEKARAGPRPKRSFATAVRIAGRKLISAHPAVRVGGALVGGIVGLATNPACGINLGSSFENPVIGF